MQDNVIIIGQPRTPRTVEITRSFAYKMNIPGAYESRDFFCSEKGQCLEDEAEDLSERLYYFCRTQVLKAVAEYQRDQKKQREQWAAKAAERSA